MNEAARVAASSHPERPIWLLAERQEAARGRQGKPWIMQDGNFAATYLYRPGPDLMARAHRSFVAALALQDALLVAAPNVELAMKWPNDVLLSGMKVAGILLESMGDYLAIGIGINLAASPALEDLPIKGVAPCNLLEQTGTRIAPEDFLPLLATAFAARETQFLTGGFEVIRADWLLSAANLGAVITARTPKAILTGTFRDVDIMGNLVLENSAGTHVLPAAEVFL